MNRVRGGRAGEGGRHAHTVVEMMEVALPYSQLSLLKLQ
jgi:hypothetical protein